MTRFRATAVALVSTVALGSFAAATVPTAFAHGGGKPAACSTQQAHVDKATAKLDALAVKFAAHPTKKNQRAAMNRAKCDTVSDVALRAGLGSLRIPPP